MAKVSQRIELNMRSFYIFNSKYGKKEGEEYKKILYYNPSDIELNTKIKDVGLSEAIIAFTSTFTADESCKALHTQKTTQLFYQPEPGYWMVLVVNVPKEIRVTDGVDVADYRGAEVCDRIYRKVVQQCYNMFRLLTGTFEMNCKMNPSENEDLEKGREKLKQQLELFFDKYLLSLKLSSCDVFNLTRSLQYLPLDKSLFLRSHNFINMIRATFPIIKDTLFLYNQQVVCSGKIDPSDLFNLHEYIVSTLLPKPTHSELEIPVLTRSNSSVSETYPNGAFTTGPDESDSCRKPPKVYFFRENKLEAHYLIVYRVLNAILCIFVNDNEDVQKEFYTELHSYMGAQLLSLARDISESASNQSNASGSNKQAAASTTPATSDTDVTSPKYIFINVQSLQHLSNISTDRSERSKLLQNIPTNVMNLLADLGDGEDGSDVSSSSAFEEVLVKTTNDYWIVKKQCNWRQFYVIIFNSKSTLLDITQEAKRVFEQELTNDVFFDK